jgi:rhodanese-related sulfurtransferase
MVEAGFGSRLGWLAGAEQEVVFVGRDDDDGRRATRLALAVGMRNPGGFLHGGMTSWRRDKRPAARIERLELERLPERLESDADLQLLDVRERSEWDAGHIPGSIHAPWHDIASVPDGVEPDRPVAVLCASGQRAAVASSLLTRHGADQVIHVTDGGVPAWERLGHAVEREEARVG